MLSKNQKVVTDLIITCNQALFEHYEVPLVHAENVTQSEIWEEDLVLVGIIGFTAKEMRGSLVLGVGSKPLCRVAEDAGQHRDWIQELSNQLLGRIKNRLIAFGVDLDMTTPMSMRGLHLVLEPNALEASPLLFHTPDGGAVCVLCDAEFTPGFELAQQEGAEEVPDEGALLLF